MTAPLITLALVRDDWRACYPADRLASLYDRPMTAIEVLTRTDGPWAKVPSRDRIWTVCHDGIMPDREFRLIAVKWARAALTLERKAGREPDPRSWAAVEMAERHANGQATDAALAAARDAACEAACEAAWDAACEAAWAAAWAAAWDTARDTARAAARAAARDTQLADLLAVCERVAAGATP